MVSGTAGRVVLSDFSGLAARVSIYTGTDNYKGENLTNPMVPPSYRDDLAADVILGRGVIIGAHSIILPGVNLGAFSSVGALCVVNDEFEPGATLVSAGGRARVAGKKDFEKLGRLADEVMAQWNSHK
jgi:acetyltransferase-like isoleucine patch superfamily enzyme